MDLSDDAAIERFRRYLRQRTVHPEPTAGYAQTVAMLSEFAAAVPGMSFTRLELSPGHPIVVLTLAGREPALGAVMLNSHMDVVPAEAGKWSVDPFGAPVVGERIYGRGAQDMKCVGSMYIEAVLRLAAGGWSPRRTLALVYVPDEEVGGERGMKLLLAHELVRRLRPVVALDEGLASPDERFSVFYGERKIWWLLVRAAGPAGHGSRFIEGAAVPKLLRVASAVAAHHEAQRAALAAAPCGCGLSVGDYTTANLTYLRAGVQERHQFNAIPTEAEAGFDVRVPCSVDLADFRAQVARWCDEAGCSWRLVAGTDVGALEHSRSDVAPDAAWWARFQAGLAAAGAPCHAPSIFSAATDGRWVRMLLGIPCFGFSPLRRLPILLHDHDEYITRGAFLEGVRVYEAVIRELCEAPEGCGEAPAQAPAQPAAAEHAAGAAAPQ